MSMAPSEAQQIEQLRAERDALQAEVEHLRGLVQITADSANRDLAALQVRIDAALTELRRQWEANHHEHCGKVPLLHESDCYWPMPEVLAALGADPQKEVDTRDL